MCFIGKVKLSDFLQQKLLKKQGDVFLIPRSLSMYDNLNDEFNIEEKSKDYLYSAKMGTLIGKHPGAHFFTVGQRKGLAIGGTKEPLFILATDVQKNIIYVGEGENHSGLFRSSLRVKKEKMHYILNKFNLINSNCLVARIRYRQPLQRIKVELTKKYYIVTFYKKQKSIAKGQFIAIYNDDYLVSSGVID